MLMMGERDRERRVGGREREREKKGGRGPPLTNINPEHTVSRREFHSAGEVTVTRKSGEARQLVVPEATGGNCLKNVGARAGGE